MRLGLPVRTKRIIRLALYAFAGIVTLAFLFVWSGVYNVAASSGHWAGMEWFLAFAMWISVKTHAYGIEAPPLDDDDLVTWRRPLPWRLRLLSWCAGRPDPPGCPPHAAAPA